MIAETDVEFVTCPECGHEQPDFGSGVCCEECKAGPMPYYDDNGELVQP